MNSARSSTRHNLKTPKVNLKSVIYKRNQTLRLNSTEASSTKHRNRNKIVYMPLDTTKSYNIPDIEVKKTPRFNKEARKRLFGKARAITKDKFKELEDSIQKAKQLSNRTQKLKSRLIKS